MTLERMTLRSKIDKLSAYFYIPVDQYEEVQQAQYDVLDALDADLVTLEPQKPDRLHITLLFIERVRDDDLEEFFNKLNLIMPVAFNLEVVRSGTFPEADEKPLVLHCAPHPALLRLQQELYDTAVSMGLPVSVHSKPKYYSPHISIAYNYLPQSIKIPDLKEPFKIPIYNFVATRPEYELVRTITLPNFHNEEVLVTRPVSGVGLGGDTTPTGQSGATTPRESDTTAGTKGKREKDQRIAEMVAGDEAEPKLPKEIRIVYTPDLDIECRQTRSREFVDIELGPPFWDIGDRGTRAGALAFQFGNILADEMIMGLGGPHEWSRADAMLQAPPKEREQGYRFIFGTNSIIWAASYAYASYIVNGPGEMQSRGYDDALRWIEIALEQYPDYDAENAPDFHSLIEELGDVPPDGVVPEYLIGKGGPGSGHHDHAGRPGEVGGSQPGKGGKGTMAVGGVAKPSKPTKTKRQYASKEFGERLDDQIGVFENAMGGIPDRVLLITDDVDAAVRGTLDREKQLMFESMERGEREGAKYTMDRDAFEERWNEENYKEKYDYLRRRIENRLSGGTIPIKGSEDEVIVYVSETLTAGEHTYTDYHGKEKTVVAQENETEYVITHELTHAVLENRDMFKALRNAHFDYLEDPKYEHRNQEIMIPRSYRNHMEKFYPDDLNTIEKEFYTDMVSYGIRLEQNPDENRVMIGGSRRLLTDDWYETDENPRELASLFLNTLRNYLRDQEEAENGGG